MPLIPVRSPPYGAATDRPTALPGDAHIEAIDVIIVPAIGADPTVVLNNLKSPHSYFQQRFFLSLKNAVVSLFDFPGGSTDDSNATSIIDHYARLLLEDSVLHRSEKRERVPLHFVGHSTGGLVVKKALLIADHELQYSSISLSCNSVAFFGVPHRGSSIMSEAPFAQSIKRVLGLKSEMSAGLREFVNPENEELVILATDFFFIARKMRKIWTFVENEDTRLKTLASSYNAGDAEIEIRLPLVDKRSAALRIGNEIIVDIGTTHAKLLGPSVFQAPASMNTYVRGLQALLATASKRDGDLDENIKKALVVDLHLFYDGGRARGQPSIKVLSVYPELHYFLSHGPSDCFEARIFHNTVNITDESHLKLPNATTALDFSRRAVAQHRRTSATSMQSSGTDEEPDRESFPLDSAPNRVAPTIKITRADDQPEIIVSSDQTDRKKDDSKDKLAHSASQKQNLSPESSYQSYINKPSNVREEDFGQIIRSWNHMTFKLPDPERRRFQWVHIPCNNLSWVPELIRCLTPDGRHTRQRLQETLLHESNLYARQSVGRHGKPHSRHMKPSFKYFPNPQSRPGDETLPSSLDSQVSLFMPYLHWDSFKSLQRRNRLVDQIWNDRVDYSTKRGIVHGESLEHKLIYQYLIDSADAPLHHRRTLDQFGYPDLRSTQARDEDQVLYKRRSRPTNAATPSEQHGNRKLQNENYEPNSDEAESWDLNTDKSEDGKVLMVDQLWCWVIDETSILTCFPPKEDENENDKLFKPGDLRNAIYNDVNGDPRFSTQCHNAFDFAALVISHATKVFIDDIHDDEDLQVFRVFEEYISILAEQHTRSFKAFRDRYREQGAYGRFGQSGRHIGEALSMIQEVDLRANEKDLTALLELRDIEDELNTIDKLFRDQAQLIEEVKKEYAEWGPKNTHGAELLTASASRVEGYRKHVESMQVNCRAAKDSFSRLLEMKQTQANLAEAWAAREANAVASSQNRAVIGFTAVTIIFLPLGFFTSLFGMNTVNWTGNGNMPKLHVIFLWTFPVSCAVILVTLLLAFNQYFRATVVLFFRRYWPPIGRRRQGQEDMERRIGMPILEKDASTGLRVLHAASVSIAGYGQIQMPDKKIE